MSELDAQNSAKDQADGLVGQVIDGRYHIDRVLAMGGMGAVYLARHLKLKKRVALKILHPDVAGRPELANRFEREAVAGAHVSHAHVAAATDFGELADGSRYLVTEYVRGRTLRDALAAEAPMPAERAAKIARQIAVALREIHQKGILHRDLKPRNVMLTDTDFVKVIDFGLARIDDARLSTPPDSEVIERLTGGGMIFGTVDYIAPEAAFGMDLVDERADFYALGVIFYEMLTGKHPFDAKTDADLFSQQRKRPPPPFAERVPGLVVDAAIEAVVMKLLEKDPDARHPTAVALIEAIDLALPAAAIEPSEPVEAAPLTLRPPPQRSTPPPSMGMRSDPPSGPRSHRAPRIDVPDATLKDGAPQSVAGQRRAPPSIPAPSKTKSLPPPLPVRPRKNPVRSVRTNEVSEDLPPPLLMSTPPSREPAADPEPSRSSEREAPALWAPREGRGVALPISVWGALGVAAVAAITVFVWWHARDGRPPGALANQGGPAVTAPTAGDAPTGSPTATPATSDPGPRSAPAASEVAAASASASAAPAPAAPSVEEKKALVDALKSALKESQLDRAAQAGADLFSRDPSALEDGKTAKLCRELLTLLAREGHARADEVWRLVATKQGSRGPDLIYKILETRGTTAWVYRAPELLRDPEVVPLETPALRIAFELRDKPCAVKPEALDRAVADGDTRSVVALEIVVRGCVKNTKAVDAALSKLRGRLAKEAKGP